MRPIAMLALMTAVTTLAMPGSARAAEINAGVDAGALLRQESSGEHSPLLLGGVRLEGRFARYLGAALSYQFSYSTYGTVLTGATQYHRLLLRPELVLPIDRATIFLAIGPALNFEHSRYSDSGRAVVSSTATRLGLSGGVGADVKLGPTRARAWLDAGWAASRIDFAVGLGIVYAWEVP